MFADRAGCSEGPQTGDARAQRLRASADYRSRFIRAVDLHSPQGWRGGPLQDMGRDVPKVSDPLYLFMKTFKQPENIVHYYIIKFYSFIFGIHFQNKND